MSRELTSRASQVLVGQAIKGERSQYIVATKFGIGVGIGSEVRQ